MTDSSGRFFLRMFDVTKPGIPRGVYRVTLLPLPGTPRQSIPEPYRDFNTTPWEVDVQSEAAAHVTHQIIR